MHANFLTTTGSQLAFRMEQHAENTSTRRPENLRSPNHITTMYIFFYKGFPRRLEYPKCFYNLNHENYPLQYKLNVN